MNPPLLELVGQSDGRDTDPLVVIAGLDPAIHPLAKRMDARVKPAHDAERAIQIDRNML
jgi:hypothetical protein